MLFFRRRKSTDAASEFYQTRRSQITDLTALIAFVIGWFASGVIGWPYIKAGFDVGNPTPGVVRFIIVIFGGAIGCALIGMLLGAIAGRIWQGIHQSRRTSARSPSTPEQSQPMREKAATAVARVALPELRYDVGEIPYEAYVSFVARFGAQEFDEKRARPALDRTINVTAWQGDTLVGLARVLSDGYFYTVLADLLVDPQLQRRGLGTELINRAFERTPRGVLFIGAPLASNAFFDRVGCDRGPTGFTMRRFARSTYA